MTIIRWAIPAALATVAAFGQTPTAPQFEVASIRPSPQAAIGQVTLGLRIDGAQVSMRQFALKDELAVAFNLKQYQVSGPDWLATEKFDIVAKLPDGAPRDQVRAMLQALMVDRFQMKTHHETRDFPVYALVVAKSGLKMKELPADLADAASGERPAVNVSVSGGAGGVVANYGNGSFFTLGEDRIDGKKMQMTNVADMLARFEEKPVARSHINAGVYALDPDALDLLIANAHCDMPTLFERLQAKGKRTVAYPMHEPWLDVGRPDDLQSANSQASIKATGQSQ